MEKLPADIGLKILCLLDHRNLSTPLQVCRKWKILASENLLWSNLFKERWGTDRAIFYAPIDSKLWKDVYEVQDRCDRVGLGLKIIREGEDYYLVHQGQIQRHLGSNRQQTRGTRGSSPSSEAVGYTESGPLDGHEPGSGILDRILFFIGDLESASSTAKRRRLV